MKMITALFAAVIAATAQADVDQTWQAARVYLPGKFFATDVTTTEPHARLPTVIYFHGCGGIDHGHDVSWARLLRSQGYAVIMPDSMARTGRRSVCDPRSRTWDFSILPQVYQWRFEEVRHSLERAQQLSWVDTDRIYVMGHSEGGYAISRQSLAGARAAIISAWTCGNRQALAVNRDVAVMHLVFTRDPWYYGTAKDGRCRDWRDDVEEVAVDRATHETYSESLMRQRVIEFLARHR
jgi:dienelactone hydrolase